MRSLPWNWKAHLWSWEMGSSTSSMAYCFITFRMICGRQHLVVGPPLRAAERPAPCAWQAGMELTRGGRVTPVAVQTSWTTEP